MKNVKYEAETLIIQRCISVKLRAAVHFLAYLSYNTHSTVLFFFSCFFHADLYTTESLEEKSSAFFFEALSNI